MNHKKIVLLNIFSGASKVVITAGTALLSNHQGSNSLLNSTQTELVIVHLADVTFYNMSDICEYIKTTFPIEYSVSGLQKWLHGSNFSDKQLKGVPYKFEQDKQPQFIEKYNKLKASVNDDEPILFMDASHPTQATKVSCVWNTTGSINQ